MGRLSEANYQSRRIKLTALLVEARQAFSDVGIRRELGEATDASVISAKAEVSTLEDRIVALDAAWDRTQAEMAIDAVAAEAQSARDSHADILALLDERSQLGNEMDQAAQALATAYADYDSRGRSIIDIALKHAQRFGRDRLGHLRDLFAGDFHDVRPAVSRTLARGGLNLQNIAAAGYATDNIHQRSVSAFVDWSKLRAHGYIEALIEAPGAKAAEA